VCLETLPEKKGKMNCRRNANSKFLTTDRGFLSNNASVAAALFRGTIKYIPCASIHYINIQLQTMTISNMQIPIHIMP